MDAVIQFVHLSNKQFTYYTKEGCEHSNLSLISNKRPESKYSNFPDFQAKYKFEPNSCQLIVCELPVTAVRKDFDCFCKPPNYENKNL